MTQNPIKGDWKKLRSLVAREWEELTDADLDDIAGDRERLVEKIQQRCGVSRDEAERELRDFERIAGAAGLVFSGDRRREESMAIDPICAMEIPEEEKLSMKFRGRTYYFCSEDCRDQFKTDPEGYAKIDIVKTTGFKSEKL